MPLRDPSGKLDAAEIVQSGQAQYHYPPAIRANRV